MRGCPSLEFYLWKQSILDETVIKILSTIMPREKFIIIRRFGLCGEYFHTLDMLKKEVELSRERVRQISFKALRKLRHPSRHAVKLLTEVLDSVKILEELL
jgi:DNA-directed RNA polymerase sigma subunit (sigma70/sigma32)